MELPNRRHPTAAELRAARLEPLRTLCAVKGRYVRWLASEGVPVVFLHPTEAETDFYEPWVPPWVNDAGDPAWVPMANIVASVRARTAAELGPERGAAVSVAYALGGFPAVAALVLGEEGP